MSAVLAFLPAAPLAGWAAHAAFLAGRLRLAHTDPLTGLPTRAAFTARAHRAIRHPHAAVLLLDLNGLKYVNDQFGHSAGDQLLATFGQRLAVWTEQHGGIAGRLGGDEFAVIVRLAPDADLHAELTEGLAAGLAERLDLAEAVLSPRAAIGVCLAAHRPGTPLTVRLRAADEAMYRAKRGGHRWQAAGRPDTFCSVNGRRVGRTGTHHTPSHGQDTAA